MLLRGWVHSPVVRSSLGWRVYGSSWYHRPFHVHRLVGVEKVDLFSPVIYYLDISVIIIPFYILLYTTLRTPDELFCCQISCHC